ncbi:histidine kinase dimerization/phosphoacceptor domain -containing protein [Candidatus Magnetominusculus dajiuhuensis]|uniref:histidine kinase dimerization/phosphoacceptor domain -containing protein n=1 Tax=Candidatus Magnetominusculus dajiuhuensis TaxID=3137712 RepID=UPI003B42EC0C
MPNKILIIDDDVEICKTLPGIFQEQGFFGTATAGSAKDGLALMRQGRYDVVVIDIVLPDMSGTSLLKELRRINPCVVCIIITGHADFNNVYEAIKAGADGFFTKPFPVEEVLQRINDSLQQKCLQKQLIESEDRYRNLVQKSSEGICNLDMDGKIVFINPACLSMLEKDEQELSGVKYVDVVNPKDLAQVEDAVECAKKGINVSLQYEISTFSTNKWVESTITPISNDTGAAVSSILIISRDITGRINLEAQLQATINEKETLLREIHHRVKNNMQVIISLLKLQSAYLKDSCNREMFKDCENRIKAMAIVHERLYRTSDMTTINFKYYVKQVANEMMSSYLCGNRSITLKITGEDFILGIDTAVPCGLIINELLSNAIKHAFTNMSAGVIKIIFKSIRTGEYEVTVKDNGVGMTGDLDLGASNTLGLTLVHMLVETQLKGKFYYKVDSGTEFHFTFTEIRHKRLDHEHKLS